MKFVLIRLGIVGLIALLVLLFVPVSPLYILKPTPEFNGKTAAQWLVQIKSPDLEESRAAIRALGNLGADGESGLEELAKLMLTSSEVGVRKESAHALGKMAPVNVKVVDSLAKGLQDKEPVVRMHCILALIKLGPAATQVLPAVLVAAKDPENTKKAEGFTTTLQESVLVALGRLGENKDDAVPLLLEFLTQSQSDDLKYAAMRGLANIGLPAKPAAPEFMKILKDPKSDNQLRQEAFEGLEKMGAPAAKSDLVILPTPPQRGPSGGAGKGGPPGGFGGGKGGPEKGGPGGGFGGGKGGPAGFGPGKGFDKKGGPGGPPGEGKGLPPMEKGPESGKDNPDKK